MLNHSTSHLSNWLSIKSPDGTSRAGPWLDSEEVEAEFKLQHGLLMAAVCYPGRPQGKDSGCIDLRLSKPWHSWTLVGLWGSGC